MSVVEGNQIEIQPDNCANVVKYQFLKRIIAKSKEFILHYTNQHKDNFHTLKITDLLLEDFVNNFINHHVSYAALRIAQEDVE